MPDSPPLIRHISDTARWIAAYRARESERPNALFRDPFARELAGDVGERIASGIGMPRSMDWVWVARTVLGDRFLLREIAGGADLVVNLAAGLDTRPYRLQLPASLQWVEVDLPEVIEYKEQILRRASPRCGLRRVALDLADVEARRALFAELGRQATRVVVHTEGLLIYLEPAQAHALAADLAAVPTFVRWVHDLANQGVIEFTNKRTGRHLAQGGVPLRFGPREGPAVFRPEGWEPLDVASYFKAAAELGRLPFFMRLLARLPEAQEPWAKASPWSAIVLQGRLA